MFGTFATQNKNKKTDHTDRCQFVKPNTTVKLKTVTVEKLSQS